MKIEKNDMVMVYDGGGTVPHCKYTGRFGDLTAYWQEIVSDAVYPLIINFIRTLPTFIRTCTDECGNPIP